MVFKQVKTPAAQRQTPTPQQAAAPLGPAFTPVGKYYSADIPFDYMDEIKEYVKANMGRLHWCPYSTIELPEGYPRETKAWLCDARTARIIEGWIAQRSEDTYWKAGPPDDGSPNPYDRLQMLQAELSKAIRRELSYMQENAGAMADVTGSGVVAHKALIAELKRMPYRIEAFLEEAEQHAEWSGLR